MIVGHGRTILSVRVPDYCFCTYYYDIGRRHVCQPHKVQLPTRHLELERERLTQRYSFDERKVFSRAPARPAQTEYIVIEDTHSSTTLLTSCLQRQATNK